MTTQVSKTLFTRILLHSHSHSHSYTHTTHTVLFLILLTTAFVTTLIVFAPPVGGDKVLMSAGETRKMVYSTLFIRRVAVSDAASAVAVYHLSKAPPLEERGGGRSCRRRW